MCAAIAMFLICFGSFIRSAISSDRSFAILFLRFEILIIIIFSLNIKIQLENDAYTFLPIHETKEHLACFSFYCSSSCNSSSHLIHDILSFSRGPISVYCFKARPWKYSGKFFSVRQFVYYARPISLWAHIHVFYHTSISVYFFQAIYIAKKLLVEFQPRIWRILWLVGIKNPLFIFYTNYEGKG